MRRHTTSDVPLHYLDLGKGQGEPAQLEPIFLLHGLGSCAADWRPQIDALGSNYRLIVPDMRGHGASPAPNGDWQIGDFANDLFNLMDQLDVPRAHIVGFSPGRHGGPGNGQPRARPGGQFVPDQLATVPG